MTSATTWSTPRRATSAWPAFPPVRPAASTIGASCRGRAPTASRRSSSWDALPAELTAEDLAAAGVSAARRSRGSPAAARRRAGGRGRVRRRRLRRRHSALVGRAPLRQSLRAARGGEIRHGDSDRQRAGDRGRQGLRHPPHRARFRRDAVSRARGPVDRRSSRRGSTRRGGRIFPGNIRSRARATASGPATTTSRSR